MQDRLIVEISRQVLQRRLLIQTDQCNQHIQNTLQDPSLSWFCITAIYQDGGVKESKKPVMLPNHHPQKKVKQQGDGRLVPLFPNLGKDSSCSPLHSRYPRLYISRILFLWQGRLRKKMFAKIIACRTTNSSPVNMEINSNFLHSSYLFCLIRPDMTRVTLTAEDQKLTLTIA